jgi:signal transduction histidine kinase
VLELVAKLGLVMVEARSLVILLKDGEELVVVAGAGHSEPRIGARIPVSTSTSGKVMLMQRPSRISNVANQLLISPRTLGVLEARSALLVPLTYRDKPIGVLAAFDRGPTPTAFTDDDEGVLVAVAASAATAVAAAQTVQADRLRTALNAAEAERKHWARELHDETLHALARLKALASDCRREAHLGRMPTSLDEVVSGLQEEIENVHAIIGELRPAALDDLGLLAAMESLVERHRAVYGIEVLSDLELPDPAEGDRRLTPELETTVYRLVQEALDNVAKHAAADRIKIKAVAKSGQLMLEIVDDGTGFDVSAAQEGFGLIGMRERAALAAGTLEIVSGSGGTAIRGLFPARFISQPARLAPAPPSSASAPWAQRLDEPVIEREPHDFRA